MKTPSRRKFLGIASGVLAATAALGTTPLVAAQPVSDTDTASKKSDIRVRFKSENIDGVDIFYREAGPEDAPVFLLLHGFPTSSRMFRNFMPLFADKYRVIAPDYPAFGHSATPTRETYKYTHEHFSRTIEVLLDRIGVQNYAMYLMDFGGPIGYRLMLKYPERVKGVIAQNTPVFGEPTDGDFWIPLLAYWKDGSASNRAGARKIISPDSIRDQYVVGTKDPSLIDPDNWTLDSALIARQGVDEIMLDLLYDIRNNRETVAQAKAYFTKNQNRVMIVTGANDALFPGESMRPPVELTGVEFHSIDSGHFALEDRCVEIAAVCENYLAKVMPI